MVDGIQILNIHSTDLSHLDWQTKVSKKTGELATKETANYRGLFITHYSNGRVKLSGSITTFFNGNNTKNLSHYGLIKAINKLCTELNIKAEKTVLNGFEIGLNIPLQYKPDKFLNNLIAWGKCEPLRWRGKKENYVQFSNSQLTLKIYSKSKQHDLNKNLLRYELRIDVMRYANKLGVFTLSDLTDKTKLKRLLNELTGTFENLIYYDSTIDTQTLKKADKNLLEKGNNPRYWSNENLHRNTLLKNRKRFKKLVEQNGKMKHHKIKKSLWLISDNILKKGVHNQQHTESSLKQKSVHNQTLTSVLNCTCIVTNYPKIISQSKGKYLTAKDIEYYYQNDKNIYTDLVEKFNTTSYKNIDYSKADLNKRFEEIAHRIRAVDFNSRNNTRNNTHRAIKRIMNEPTISLFDNWQLISDNKKELAQINNY